MSLATLSTDAVLPRRAAPASFDGANPADLANLTRRIAAHAEQVDEQGRFPHEALAVLRELGLPGLVVPRALGGCGADLAQARRVVAAVAQGDPSAALVLTMQYMLTRALSHPDCRWPQAVREQVLVSAVRDGAMGNNLRVEPELGSPARGGLPGSVLRRSAGGWRLSGHKLYTTGIDGLRWLVVWARTDEAQPRVGQVLVAADSPGLRLQRSWDHLGMRGTASDELLFEDVFVPADHAVDLRAPAEWQARPDADQQAWMVVLLGALYDAVARNAHEWLLGFLNQRAPASLGAPLASLARVQEQVGEIGLLLLANRSLLDQATQAADAGRPWSVADSGLLKAAVTRNAVAAVQLAIDQSGNHGLSRRNPLQRHFRDVLCGRVHTPQDDAALSLAGRAALQAWGERARAAAGAAAEPN